MKRYLLIIIIIFGISSIVLSNQQSVIDRSVFKNPQRSSALFNHDDHNEKAELEDCAICHHVYEDKKLVEGESSEDDSCSSCHTLKRTEKNIISIRTAFHKRCKRCHFKVSKGPVLCGECHIK
ncbi:MAG: cytochrome c3 family protein [Desulfobacterales bacterium]|nr:cytochrome c3 family protein [Desulfobacterales bacterium]MCP4163435.1 cytochrome c3 family protein [Deltaproteobacteria bacterium]